MADIAGILVGASTRNKSLRRDRPRNSKKKHERAKEGKTQEAGKVKMQFHK